MSLCFRREILENQNVTWNDNGTLSYIPKRSVVFKPELSVGNPVEDRIRVPNIPMLVSILYTITHTQNFLDRVISIQRLASTKEARH